MRKTVLLFGAITALVLAGCAKHSGEIMSSRVSPVAYQDYTCKQLQAEVVGVSRRAGELMNFIDDKAEGDETATAVGLILLWPALFFI
jgi:outer membrane lipoprotein SlyB